MRKISVALIAVAVIFVIIRGNLNTGNKQDEASPAPQACREICGTIEKGETLFDIFKKYGLNVAELLKLKEASADIHRLKKLYPGRSYKITVDEQNVITSFVYWIDDDTLLDITQTEAGFCAEKKRIEYEKRIHHLGGTIKDNLILSVGEGREDYLMALQLSDILAWDIDFTTDLRNGDQFKIVVEGLYLDGVFRKYGEILSAEFVNNGETYHAYRYAHNGEAGYYDADGRSLKRAFLKAPLSYRRISSTFSKKRFHPVLRIYRPHHGLDYAAPSGTPVSAVGDGTVIFSGYKGNYGKLVVIKHPNRWKTYYGHLSRIDRSMKRGRKVSQGAVIGHVGSTGLATGPHLHYEVRVNDKPVNPLSLAMPRGSAVPEKCMAEFRRVKDEMDIRLASVRHRYFARSEPLECKEKGKQL